MTAQERAYCLAAYAVRLLCVPLRPFVALYCVLSVASEGLLRKAGFKQ